MRLIDADALKEQFREGAYTVKGIREEIDNAPTVDTTCPNCDSGYAQGYSDGYLKGKEERPQGEWGKWIISVIQCPNCLECFNFPTRVYSMEMLKECPNCGADMRVKNELNNELNELGGRE